MKLTRLGPSSVDSNSEGAYFSVAPGTPTISGNSVTVLASEVMYNGNTVAIPEPTLPLTFAFAAEGFKRKDIIVARYTTPAGYYIIAGQEVAESGAAIAPTVPFNRLLVSDLDVSDGTGYVAPDPTQSTYDYLIALPGANDAVNDTLKKAIAPDGTISFYWGSSDGGTEDPAPAAPELVIDDINNTATTTLLSAYLNKADYEFEFIPS